MMCRENLKNYRPKMYLALKRAGKLETYCQEAADHAVIAVQNLLDRGYQGIEAEEIVLPKYILLPSEEEMPNLGEIPDLGNTPGTRRK